MRALIVSSHCRKDDRMAITQLVWDMDGTLLDSTVVVPAAFIGAVRELGGPDVDREEVVAAYSLGTPEVILAHLVGRGLEASEADAYYRRLGAVAGSPYPGVAGSLEALRELGHAVAVFTGASSRAASMLLEGAGLDVDVLVGGDDIERPKPAPDGLLLIAERLGLAPADLAYVGDSPLDLRAAAAAGSHSAAAAWGHLYEQAEPADFTLDRPEKALTLLSPGRHYPGTAAE
jgi:HAD superfamily hydrolase (TIGR01509 family)